MKALLTLIGGVVLLYLLPLALLSALIGWVLTLLMDIKWSIACFISFLLLLFALQTLDVIGGTIGGILKYLKTKK